MTIAIISIVVALTILYLVEMNQQNPLDQPTPGVEKKEDVIVESTPILVEEKETVIEKTEEIVKPVKKKSPKKPKKKD